MKNYISKIITLFIFITFAGVISSSINAQVTGYQWTELTYHYQTGTVSPIYFYSYDLTLNTTGDISLVYSPGYITQQTETWSYKLKTGQQNIDTLNSMLASSCIFDSTIEALPPERTPIGGSLQNMVIVLKQDELLDQAPKRITVPYFPKCEVIKETLKTIYEYIKSLVPENTWNEINAKKEEYIKSQEK
jgi:hypothetical protein